MENGVEPCLEVDAFREAVSGDEDPSGTFAKVGDAAIALLRYELSGDRDDLSSAVEALGEVVSDVVSGVDEAAETDRVEAVVVQLLEQASGVGELGVSRFAVELSSELGELLEAAPVRSLIVEIGVGVVGVAAGGDVQAGNVVAVFPIENGASSCGIGFCDVVGSGCRSARCDGGDRRRRS